MGRRSGIVVGILGYALLQGSVFAHDETHYEKERVYQKNRACAVLEKVVGLNDEASGIESVPIHERTPRYFLAKGRIHAKRALCHEEASDVFVALAYFKVSSETALSSCGKVDNISYVEKLTAAEGITAYWRTTKASLQIGTQRMRDKWVGTGMDITANLMDCDDDAKGKLEGALMRMRETSSGFVQ